MGDSTDLPPSTSATASTPIILCGDFGSSPVLESDEKIVHPALQSRLVNHSLTAPFHILTRGSLPTDHPGLLPTPPSLCRLPFLQSTRTLGAKESSELNLLNSVNDLLLFLFSCIATGMFFTRNPKLLMSNIYQLDSFRDQQPLWTTKVSYRLLSSAPSFVLVDESPPELGGSRLGQPRYQGSPPSLSLPHL